MDDEPISYFQYAAPPGRAKYDWEALADRCYARPGDWVQIFEHDRTSYVETLRQGATNAIGGRKAGFEVKTRYNKRTKDPETGKEVRTCAAWIRYIPSLDTRGDK